MPYGVIGRDPEPTGPAEEGAIGETEFDQHLDVVPASLAKGLEFDHVVLLEPAAIVAGEPDRVTGLRRLYVCLTRAVTSLVIAHAEPLPPELVAATLSDRALRGSARPAPARWWSRPRRRYAAASR